MFDDLIKTTTKKKDKKSKIIKGTNPWARWILTHKKSVEDAKNKDYQK